jgi:alpha-ribazole phosphatase
MKHNVYLLRHAKTAGNIGGRYIGRTDEPLAADGIKELCAWVGQGRYPQVQHIFVSPMLRCLQTMAIIYPGLPYTIVPELAECNFGLFENKTNEELKGIQEYQSWIDSGGQAAFPQGEDIGEFKARCRSGWETVMDRIRKDRLASSALIAHGGTIMAVLEGYAQGERQFYQWQAKNGEGYRLTVDEELWTAIKKIEIVTKL